MNKKDTFFSVINRIYVRPVPDSFINSIRSDPTLSIDIALAREQWKSYINTIKFCGLPVVILPRADDLPDSVFIEDTAIVIDNNCVFITEPGHPLRRPEAEGVRKFLARDMEVIVSQPGASIDGGDVLRYYDTLFVGLSGRTTARGVNFLRNVARRRNLKVVEVNVPKGLHLKTYLSLVDDSTMVFYPESEIDVEPFEDAGLAIIEASELCGANVLSLGNNKVLIASMAKNTGKMLESMGYDVISVDISEIAKADGALTCQSIRVPEAGGWCS
ncbi:MAG: hypothetical protein HQK54_00090 [Oligoflexales bacterium]|nr:hypothetical protein [Oligoflexales bacterium]